MYPRRPSVPFGLLFSNVLAIFFEKWRYLYGVYFWPISGLFMNEVYLDKKFHRVSLSKCRIFGTHWWISDTDVICFSESSMFISENRFILKTCGTTTLLNAVKPLVDHVKKTCGYTKILVRENFGQPSTHAPSPTSPRPIPVRLIAKNLIFNRTAQSLSPISGQEIPKWVQMSSIWINRAEQIDYQKSRYADPIDSNIIE